MAQSTTFAAALRVARRNSADPDRGGHLTLERLAELISQRLATDNQPTPQTVGNWERGFSRPSQKDRDMLMALVAVLAACRGLSRPTEADQLLSLGGYAALSEAERVACFGESPDAALSLAPATPAPPFTVPYPPNPLFVGRDADLEHLYDLLRPDASVALVPAVAGTGGIGKTQLAIEFAHHYCNQFPGGVFWLTMTDDASVRTQLVDYAGPRGLNLSGWPAMGYDDRIAAVRAAWQQPHIRLLIFDNLEDPALLAWRPTSGGCRVLITSRRLTWHRHSGVEALPLDVLARPDSRRLLLTPRYGDRSVLPGDAATADAICEELGDLPLALVLAGIYLEATPSMALDAYLVRLRAASVNHPSLNALLEEGLPTGHAPSILATFDLSYARLGMANSTDALALRLLHCAAWCAPVAIPRRLLLRAASLDPDDVDAQAEADHALRRLAAVGLIEPLPDGALRLHRLLAAYARSHTADPTGDCAAVEQALVAETNDVIDASSPQTGQVYLDHLRLAVARADSRDDDTVVAKLMNNLAALLYREGVYVEAHPLFERALAMRERVLGPEHPDTATSLNNLALLFKEQGAHAEAHPLYERALAIRERVLGPEHPDTAASLNNLAALSHAQRDYATARPLYERALAIRERVLGPEHLDTSTSLSNLGSLLKAQGALAEARTLYERALAIRERLHGPEHPSIAVILGHLGSVLRAQGALAEARTLYERALAICERILGPDHPATGRSLHNLSLLLREQGDYAAARTLLERALMITEHARGPEHPATATYLSNLAALLHKQGNYAEARALYERALLIYERAVGPDDLDAAKSLKNLALLLKEQGAYGEARALYEGALVIFERVLGPDHSLTRTTQAALAKLDDHLRADQA